MYDLMIDIETLATDSNALVCSISAIQFNLDTGQIGEKFEIGLNWDEQISKGAVVDMGTVRWWLSQDKQAQNSLLSLSCSNVNNALNDFNRWLADTFKSSFSNIRLWGNGATFDNVIVENLFKRHNVEFFIRFWNHRDVRTLVDVSNIDLRTFIFEGIKHNGLDDCKHQIKYCVAAKKLIKEV